MENLPVTDEERKARDLARMKRAATGLLVGVTLVFSATFFVPTHGFWLELIRAMAEAAMVGALADWFAVTALFRHPLGIPIPHTAIIPHRKDQIGAGLGRFIQHNFLTGEIIARRLRVLQLSRKIATWISTPENGAHVARLAAAGAPGVLNVVNDRSVQQFIAHSIQTHLKPVTVTPIVGQLLDSFLTPDRQRILLRQLVDAILQFTQDNQEAIRERIKAETPWWIPVAIDDKIYQRIVRHIEQIDIQIHEDENHPLHLQFSETLQGVVDDLQHSDDLIRKGEAWKDDILGSIIVPETSKDLWESIKSALSSVRKDDESPSIETTLQEGITRIGTALLANPDLLQKVDDAIEDVARRVMEAYGDEIGHLIAHTIQQWDPDRTSRKIELHVGRDLQYIRINGTVIGGLVGLALHLLTTVTR
ncbi:MAG: DUF445 domain-containing protein [candidate division Zixibacteria bacterium]|nr:DUF445 domain-containing protein [candidate division Zixibacteria bacterium]